MTSLVLYEKAKTFKNEVRKYLKRNGVSEFEIDVLEENINAYIGSKNQLRSIGVDAHNNVWVTATNFNDPCLIKSFVLVFKSNSGSYTIVKPFGENITSLHDKLKVLFM